MADSEWKLPVHREGKIMGFKNNMLLDRGEGKHNQGVRFLKMRESVKVNIRS